MRRWMTRRTDGWKASSRPRRRLLYKNIRSPFLYFFLFRSFFLCVFCIPFLFQFFFKKVFQIIIRKWNFISTERKRLLIFFLMILFFLFIYLFIFQFSISQAILFYFRIALFFNNNHKTRNNLWSVSVFWSLFLSLRRFERRLARFMPAATITAHTIGRPRIRLEAARVPAVLSQGCDENKDDKKGKTKLDGSSPG